MPEKNVPLAGGLLEYTYVWLSPNNMPDFRHHVPKNEQKHNTINASPCPLNSSKTAPTFWRTNLLEIVWDIFCSSYFERVRDRNCLE